MRPKLVGDLLHHTLKISACAVHLVNEGNPWHTVLVSLSPDSLRLRLHATDGTEDSNSTVKNPERPLYFNSEVNVTRSIDKVDLVQLVKVFPECCRGCGCNCDPSLLLLHHPVHSGIAVMNFAKTVYTARKIKYALGKCCLSGVNVGPDANVSGISQIVTHPFFFATPQAILIKT